MKLPVMANEKTVTSSLTTERLALAPVATADAPQLHRLLADPDVRHYLTDGKDLGLPWVEELVVASNEAFETIGVGLWAARRRGEAEIVGLAGFAHFFDPPVLELLYALQPAAWGAGIATEMARAAIDAGRAAGLGDIRASADAPNSASLAVMARLGFEEVSREPADPPNTIWEQVHTILRHSG